ncbi:MAG: stage II sporulation protein R [Clostridia bacterium]|nr:stage II sporulation protein R [Clostridia bacterium]
MKTAITALLSFVLAVFLCIALPIAGEEKIYEGVVRLHVLANSDTAEDQNLKIEIRDFVLSSYGEMLTDVKNAQEAQAYLQENLSAIQRDVEEFLKSKGKNTPVTVTLEEERFHTRAYENVTLPAGTYTSLTVQIGAGKGQNWWCVLYPALCTQGAMGEKVAQDAFKEEEYSFVTKSGYAVKFRTLEILETIFG